jgi:hypothetical protein
VDGIGIPASEKPAQKPTSLRVHLPSQQARAIDGKKARLGSRAFYSVRVQLGEVNKSRFF